MGLSRLLQQHTSFRFRTIGFARQTRLQCSSSAGNKPEGAANETKTQAHEKHIDMHTGTFSKPSHIHREIGGSWYTFKELFQNAKEKIFGSFKVQNDSSNDVKSSSIAEVMTTPQNGSGKFNHGEASNTQENVVCGGSNTPPSAVPCTYGEQSSGMMGDTVLDAKRPHKNLESTKSCKPKIIIQSSAQMISKTEDNRVNRAISNATENHCSEVLPNSRTSIGVCDAPYQTMLFTNQE